MITEVKFTQHYGIYNSGERAGFSQAEADEMVRKGVATAVSEVRAPQVAEVAEAAEAETPKGKAKK